MTTWWCVNLAIVRENSAGMSRPTESIGITACKTKPEQSRRWCRISPEDHRPDLLVLFAQGDERFVLYTNRGNGKFSAKQLLRFLPVVGSTSFELTDWNEDGHPDILYTSGDNADHSPIIKPYHGITLFVNDGSNHFREAFFLEHPGAYQAHAADYDHDGDQDIAAISFFPDYARQPQTGFVFYQKQRSGPVYAKHLLPGHAGKVDSHVVLRS